MWFFNIPVAYHSQSGAGFTRLLTILCLILSGWATAQPCVLQISGQVTDEHTGEALDVVNVYLRGTQTGTITGEEGNFLLTGLCPGEQHLVFSHLGCTPVQVFINLQSDTVLHLELEHSDELLHMVMISGGTTLTSTQHAENLNQAYIEDHSEEGLAGMLEQITGVHLIRNGNAIAKPVVQGMYGNRLMILNNGLPQSGQQWGNDHSPEIDPLSFSRIEVIKGAAALEYPGAGLGSVIRAEPGSISGEPHIHGKAGYFFRSNGFQHTVYGQLQQGGAKFSWRANGTLRYGGDQRSATYWLNNTGAREANLSLQLEQHSRKFRQQWYVSTFNTELGVLRGSHISNLTDLEQALEQEEPFFTEAQFDYGLEAPRQRVQHHLLQWRGSYRSENGDWFEGSIGTQYNDRKEYDVRRSGRSDIPALRLQQWSTFARGIYQREWADQWKVKSGVQLQWTDNTNNPETGILPLIPDYRSLEPGVFVLMTFHSGRSFFEWGGRLDGVHQDVVAISQTVPREILRYENNFLLYRASAGWVYRLTESLQLDANVGYALRNPAINELYSNGLHQGVSGIEEGDPDLQPERSLKSTLGVHGTIGQRFTLEGMVYTQCFQDFIYLEPQDEIRLTIRGAFPVFHYAQTDARLFGFDGSVEARLQEALSLKVDYSWLRGEDLDEEKPLVFMPPNRLNGELRFSNPGTWKMGKARSENLQIALQYRYVFTQNRLLPEQDFVPAPDAYGLLGMEAGSDWLLRNWRFRSVLRVDNALNTSYRDYLNRLRYFADDTGWSVTLGWIVYL